MKAQKYQRGSLALRKRKRQPDLWEFRFYTEERGRTVYRRQTVGSVVDFPTRKDAEKAVAQLRVKINDGAAFAPITIEQLVDHYKLNELPENHSFSTMEGYKNILDTHVIPKWGACRLSEIKSMKVENWLRGLQRKDGKPASPAYRSKIRNVMSALFSHAIRNEWALTNPITAVRTSAKRLRTPDILMPEEFRALLAELEQRERVLVLLVAATGLRRGKLIALRWCDIDFEHLLVNVTHSVWHSVEGDTKTVASRRPVPLPPLVVAELENWRRESIYRSDGDYVFASVLKNGTQPLQPEMILRRHIRPVLERLQVEKRIGWHSFRHGLATLLTAQELLRHANSRITLDIYQQSVPEERRAAQALAFRNLVGGRENQTIKHQDLEEKEGPCATGEGVSQCANPVCLIRRSMGKGYDIHGRSLKEPRRCVTKGYKRDLSHEVRDKHSVRRA